MTDELGAHLAMLISIQDRVSKLEISPSQAEEEAKTLGLTFVKYITEPASELSSKSWWPLTLGTIWITRREIEATAKRWADFKVWKRGLWLDDYYEEQHVRLQDAETALLREIEAGTIQASGIDSETQERVMISPLYWIGAAWVHDDIRQVVRNAHQAKRYFSVMVSRSELQIKWPPIVPLAEGQPHSSSDEMSKKNKKNAGGRIAVHDWAALAGYLVYYLVENDYPAAQAELVRAASDWFQRSRGKVPDSRDVERFVKTIYDSRQGSGET